MKTHLWLWWAEIAIDQRNLARSGRKKVLKNFASGNQDISLESRPAMIAVAAASHAIDAFYGEAKEFIPLPASITETWRRNRTGRPERIRETLKRGFRVGRHDRRWKKDFDWLFDLRDAALHHSSENAPPVPHPALPTNISPENADYCVEAADRAAGVMLDIFERCIDAAKPGLPQLSEWAGRLQPTVLSLRERAGQPAGQ
jgi:hypothetical protein